MVKKIIQVADIHIRRVMDVWENNMYAELLNEFIDKCKEIAKPYEREEVRIVICGDLFHNKNNISNDLDIMATNFIRNLESIAPVRILVGNHDFNANNIDQAHTITTFCETRGFQDTILLDEVLDYRSGCLNDDNITWVVYSAFDDFIKPDLISIKEECPNNIIIGLYHDMIIGATMNNGAVSDIGASDDTFDGCDCVMAGHIHKRQVLRRKGIDIVYSGSLFQQNFGETVSQHGFCVWDVENLSHEFVDLKSTYGFYNLELNSLEDINEDKVKLINV